MKKLLGFVVIIQLLSCSGKVDNNKLFSRMPSNTTGVQFKNVLKETKEFNVLTYGYLYNGGGISAGDINNDGLTDLYFTGSMVGSRLYINKGNFEFEDIARQAGVFAEGLWNTGTTMVDINADGLLDIYVCRSAAKDELKRKNLLFINNGNLTFTEKAEEFGIADSGYSTQGSFFDYDKDGDLDLYVLNHSTQEYSGFALITSNVKKRKNPAFADRFYKNENGKFVDVSQQVGLISNVLGFGLGISVSDINNDSWPDIYVSNDFNEQDYLYINNQNGTFSENLENYMGHISFFSMGTDIADINNDGNFDVMSLDMLPEDNSRIKMVTGPDNYDKFQLLENSGYYNQSMRNMLHLNDNGKSLSEIGQFSGVSNTDWSWAPLMADFDNDGLKDIYITNGYKRDYTNMDFMNYVVQEKLNENKTGQQTAIEDLLKNIPSSIIENYIYKNNGDLTFSKMNQDWGMDEKSLSNGAAYADLDNDGDLDLVVNNIDEEPFIYRNNSEAHLVNGYLKIKLKGNDQNTMGIGAKIALTFDDQTIVQEMMPTRGFQSSVDYNLVFGLGEAKKVDKLEIIWPDSKIQTLEDLKINQALTLNQKDAASLAKTEKVTPPTLLTDITTDSLLTYDHVENDFIDFKREQLLPHMLSTQGPKIAKGDVNNDGLEDVYVGGAKGHPGKLFFQNKAGKFLDASNLFLDDSKYEDIGALFFDADGDKDLDLYVVSGGNDFNDDSKELQDRIYLNNGSGNFEKSATGLPSMLTSGSCVSASDFDDDGDQDLFIGGRLVPGKYPTAPRSYILTNDGTGNFTDATLEINHDLAHPGMVTDALWSDIDNDNQEDLIIVGEFMPVRVFKNNRGKLSEIKGENGLSNSNGWWNSIEKGDFDNDGDIDFILGNFGLNSQLKASADEPVTLYAKDFDSNGSIDPVLCSFNLGENYPVFSKDDLVGQLNGLKSKYVNYSDYADQKVTDVFTSEELKDAVVLKATNFSSSYLENLGNGKFDLKPLPSVAQFSPIYGILPKDINGDDNLDILLAGNFFGNRVKFGRYDANKGLLLIGDGKGNFSPTSNLESGLDIDGEVRDIISIERNNGTELILFARNNAAVKAYRKGN